MSIAPPTPRDPLAGTSGALISLFAGDKRVTIPEQEISLAQFIAQVRDGTWKQLITPIHDADADGDKDEKRRLKGQLPAVTLSCTMANRDKDAPVRLLAHSGWLQCDFDLDDNPQLSQRGTRAGLAADPHVGAVFVGPSGAGIKAAVRVDPTRHAASFLAAKAHFLQNYGLAMDDSCKDAVRLCYVSYDPKAWLRDGDTIVLPVLPVAPARENALPRPPALQDQHRLGDEDWTASDVRELLAVIPPRPAYDTWLRVASGVFSVLDYAAAFTVLNEWSPEEKAGEYERKYTNRLEAVHIGTVVQYAKDHGFDAKAFARRKHDLRRLVSRGAPASVNGTSGLAGRENGPRVDTRQPPELSIQRANDRPGLRLPGDDRPLGEFASEVGQMLKDQHIFARKGCAFTLDSEGQRLEPATATWLRSWAEKFVTCYKVKRQPNGMEIRPISTMTEDAARVVLVAPQFLERLRRAERFHPCRMPVIRSDGRLELLPEGHDAESATFTATGAIYDPSVGEHQAKAILDEALAEFPFADDGGRSKAVAVAALLTVYGAGLMPQGASRPAFLYLGNAEGTGKTTAARLAGIPRPLGGPTDARRGLG